MSLANFQFHRRDPSPREFFSDIFVKMSAEKSNNFGHFLRGRIRITLIRLTLKIPHNRSASKTIKVERKWNAIKVTGGKWIDRKSHLFAKTIPSAATKFTNITKTALFISFLYLKTRFYFIVNIYLIFLNKWLKEL